MSSNIDELLAISKSLTVEYISELLSKWFKKPTEFVKHEFGGGTAKGDSYLSDVYRVTFYGKTLDSNENVHVKLIIKALPMNIARRKTFKSHVFFRNEINFYLYIFPELMKFQSTKKMTEPFDHLPKFFGAVTDGENDFLALEDLSIYDYGSAARQEGIDYPHFQIILECFAKYHAISFAFKDQNPEKFAELTKYPIETYYHENHWNWYKTFWKDLCVCAIDAVEKEYPGTIYVDKIKEFATDKTYFDQAKIANICGETGVFSHGDSWTPNFLIKYKPGTTTPIDAKMIDFQLGRCASPILDIGFFIYACSSQDIRKEYYHKMLKYYHDILSNQIKEMGSDPNKLYSWDVFMREVKDYSFFGLAFSLESTPVTILEPEDAFEMDSITGTEAVEITNVWIIKPIKTQAGRLRLAGNVIHAVDNGYI